MAKKCNNCGKELISKNEVKMFANKPYCETCYNIVSQESKQLRMLKQYVCEIFSISVVTPLIDKQIKSMKNEYHYDYSGIHYTLWYMLEIENVSFDVKYGISLVSSYYLTAKRYYIEEQTRNEINKLRLKQLEKMKPKVNYIKYNKSDNQTKDKLLFNLSDIVNSK